MYTADYVNNDANYTNKRGYHDKLRQEHDAFFARIESHRVWMDRARECMLWADEAGWKGDISVQWLFQNELEHCSRERLRRIRSLYPHFS